MQLIDYIKSFFCRHNHVFVRNIYGDEIIYTGWKRSWWACTKCGFATAKDRLHHGE